MTPDLSIRQPSHAEGMMRALGIKGDLPSDLAATFAAFYQLENLSAPEFQWTRRARLYDSGLQAPAVVGQLSAVTLQPKPGTARSMAIVESILITAVGGATGIKIKIHAFDDSADLLDLANVSPRDDRVIGPLNVAHSGYRLAGGSFLVNPLTANDDVLQFVLPAGGIQLVPGPWILTGNVASGVGQSAKLLVLSTTANIDIRVAMVWRERELMQEEL